MVWTACSTHIRSLRSHLHEMILSAPFAFECYRIPAIHSRSSAIHRRYAVAAAALMDPNHPVRLSAGARCDELVVSPLVAAPPIICRGPESGLLSLIFVLSMVLCSFISLAIVSIPSLFAFRKLKVSADKLSKVVSEEVPGTLAAFKLSSLEINELTERLSSLRQRISGSQYGKKVRRTKRNFPGRRSDSITS